MVNKDSKLLVLRYSSFLRLSRTPKVMIYQCIIFPLKPAGLMVVSVGFYFMRLSGVYAVNTSRSSLNLIQYCPFGKKNRGSGLVWFGTPSIIISLSLTG